MRDYKQRLREAALDTGKTPEDKAFALNLIEALIAGDITTEEIIKAISTDTLPIVYRIIGKGVK